MPRHRLWAGRRGSRRLSRVSPCSLTSFSASNAKQSLATPEPPGQMTEAGEEMACKGHGQCPRPQRGLFPERGSFVRGP